VDESEAGIGQHGFCQASDAADDVQADADRAAQGGQFVDQCRNTGRRVQQLAVNLHDAASIDGRDPVYLLGNIDSDADPHGVPLFVTQHPARAVFALHSDESQSLISGRGGVAVPGDLPLEPSWAASVKTIPAPPPRRDPGRPGSRRQALPKQHLNSRAA
jgi:hypothetical protein